VLDDALGNLVTYAPDHRPIAVRVELDQAQVVVVVADHAAPFDPLVVAAPDTSAAAQERPIGGLGIHLMRTLMSDVQYGRDGDRNVLRLTLKLTGVSDGADDVDEAPRSTSPASAAKRDSPTRAALDVECRLVRRQLFGRTENDMSTLDIKTEDKAGVVVVRLIGSLDTATSAAAMEQLHALVAPSANKTRMLLDCSALTYVSSAGLRVFLTTTKKLTAAGGALRVSGLNETVREVFEISGFVSIFKVFATDVDALAGF
jgi:anti-anti-sigma factor